MLACSGKQTTAVTESVDSVMESVDAGTKTFVYADSCQHVIVNMSLELPMGDDSVSVLIRDSLVTDFIDDASNPDYNEEITRIKPFDGDRNDYKAMVEYYGKAVYKRLLSLAKADYKERIKFLDEDTTRTVEEKKMIREDVPQWTYQYQCKKTTEAEKFVVYYSQTYVYFGGAHGGITGRGAMTFDKSTGHMVQRFLKPTATKSLQKMFRKGIRQYFAECGDTVSDEDLDIYLQLMSDLIPQPVNTPYPNAAGDTLIFTYQQYEIASYAAGMPSFGLPVEKLAPYLTDEAKKMRSCQK